MVVAPSFADIFYNNCFKNGLLPVVLSEDVVDELFREVESTPGYRLSVDLESRTVTTPGGAAHAFEVDEFRRHCLLEGLDDIGLTLQHVDAIRDFETRHRDANPWLFG